MTCFVKDVLFGPKHILYLSNEYFLKPAHCCVVPYQKRNQEFR